MSSDGGACGGGATTGPGPSGAGGWGRSAHPVIGDTANNVAASAPAFSNLVLRSSCIGSASHRGGVAAVQRRHDPDAIRVPSGSDPLSSNDFPDVGRVFNMFCPA
ncbi:hypothetical protein MSAS_52340 [Mycobacterium saskatchewanense]|nr:hypothetical protein MSAS_52340 [Mycobacterium saskatchewanense]